MSKPVEPVPTLCVGAWCLVAAAVPVTVKLPCTNVSPFIVVIPVIVTLPTEVIVGAVNSRAVADKSRD